MFKNYLHMAWRNLLKNKSFSFINILGLAIGMAACLLILQYVTFQFSFDDFHVNQDRIYRVVLGESVPGRQVTPPALGPALKREFPQVVQFARLQKHNGVVSTQENIFSEDKIYWADASFLTMFSYPLLKGNPATALSQPHTIVISQATARKYFSNLDPVGKQIQISNADEGYYTFVVTGVLENVPQYSHLQFDMLLSYATLKGEEYENAWNWRNFSTYVLLSPAANPQVIETSLPRFVQKILNDNKDYSSFWLQSLSDIHLSSVIKESSTDPAMIYFLLMLALFILMIAWINYINLSTARSVERAKEVGVRKAVGASRFELFKQFLLETILLNGLAITLAFTIIQLSLPYFRQLTGLDLSLTLWTEWNFWAALLILFLIGTFLSGMYPALILSSFKPVAVLKGKVQVKAGNLSLRKSLVVFQFAASIALMAGTFTVYYQMEFMRNQDLGINIDQTLVVKGPQLLGDSSSIAKQWNVFKMQMQNMAAIKSITASDAVPSKAFNNYHGRVVVEGMPEEKDPAKKSVYAVVGVDADFMGSFGLSLLAGRSFSKELATDAQTAVLNEEAIQRLGFTNPQEAIGKILQVGKRRLSVIGIIKNYHHSSLNEDFFPTIFRFDPARTEYFSLKLNTGNDPTTQLKETLSLIERTWKQVYPGNPFEYFFLDEAFDAQYKADQQLGRTIGLFAFLAIFVACLGLFGLASFTTTQRTKEIGVRKVLGASASHILFLLSKDFIKLILLANLIAWPLAYWTISSWLENYAFSIQINFWLFMLPSLLVLIIALLTVSMQTLKAARRNPVQSLRYE